MFSGIDRKSACVRQADGQRDGQTPCDGIVRATHTRRAIKIRCKTMVQSESI